MNIITCALIILQLKEKIYLVFIKQQNKSTKMKMRYRLLSRNVTSHPPYTNDLH